MMTPRQLPNVHDDEGFKRDAKGYTERVIMRYRLDSIAAAITEAYLDGAQRALQTGYALAERDYEKLYKLHNKIEDQ